MIKWIKRIILISRLEKLLKELLMNGKITSRKFWLIVGIILAVYTLVWKGLCPIDKFLSMVEILAGGYLGANILAKLVCNPKEKKE